MLQEDGILPVTPGRSGCPINMTMELLGDRWSLIVLRDLMFGSRQTFNGLLEGSTEGIATNILASRLARLTAAGLLSREADPAHRQRAFYRLAEPAIELVPTLAQLGAWGARWLPTTPDLRIRAELLAQGGPTLWDGLMNELRAIHLRGEERPRNGVLASLDEAYAAASATPPLDA